MMSSPEPMTLGSPTQSPTHVNQYLPQFLLGDLPNSNPNQHNHNHHQQQHSNFLLNPNQNFNLMNNNSNNGGVSGFGASSLMRDDHFHSNHHHHHHGRVPSYGSMNRDIYSSNNNNNPFNASSFNYPTGSNINYSNYSPSRALNEKQAIQQQQQQTLPAGAPPVSRLADVINKPAHHHHHHQQQQSHSATVHSIYQTPNESRIRQNFNLNESVFPSNAYEQSKANDQSFTPSSSQIIMSRTSASPPSPPPEHSIYHNADTPHRFDDKLNLDASNLSNDNSNNNTWITVFGFPSSSTSFVLQEFAAYGQILKHVICSQGNWMHIQYQTKLQAQKALSKNGKVLGNSVMVGVMKCIDTSVMSSPSQTQNGVDTSKDAAAGTTSSTSFVAPQQQQQAAVNTSNRLPSSFASRFNQNSGVKLDRSQSLRTPGVRPLGQFNRNLEQTNEAQKLPKKNTNVISKAMEYMFGW